jgi:acyl-CoA synthetase (AMP-forming)/AMP-acid ligase II
VNHFRNLVDALEAAPARRPFVTFWVDEDERETVTFGEFRQRALSKATVLQENGVRKGDHVVVIMPQGIAAMTTFIGAMMLGAVPAFLAYPNFKIDPSKYSSGLRGVTANLGAKVVAIDQQFPDEMLAHVSLSHEANLLRVGDGSDLPGASVSTAEIPADQFAFIQHSAGTTGLQKGVALTHAAVLRQLGYLADALKIDESDRIYSWLPLYHDMGLIACFMLPMVAHMHVVMQSPLDWVMSPGNMLQIMSDCECTLAWLPNFAFQFVPRRTPKARWEHLDLSSMRAIINCSEPVRTASMKEFQEAFAAIGLRSGVLQSSYAMAENVFAATQSDMASEAGPTRIWADGQTYRAAHRVVVVSADTPGAISFTSSGRLLPNHEIRIVSEFGERLGEGFVGEIYLKSDCMFQGYYNRPDLSHEVIVDGWYRTGDLGFHLDGELYVVGRKKDLLIVGGENIYPQDIEEIVAAHPAIHDGRAVAMGVFNPNLGTEDIVVVAEVEQDDSLTRSAEIEKELRSSVVAGLGVAVRTFLLKPPKWIVKSTAGKPARANTLEKLLKEHPEFNSQP